MGYFVNVINKKNGEFELIDGDFLNFYPDLNQDELIEISDEQLNEYYLRQNELTRFDGGKFVYTEIAVDLTALLTEQRQRFIENIDNKAASIYSLWTRFEQEYSQREAAANAFKAANYTGDASRFIVDFASKAGLDNKTATDLILLQTEGLRKLLVELANQRMRKYELKNPDLTETQLQSIYDDIVHQMELLAEAYQ